MAKRCVAILHGWSDKGQSFEPLRAFLSSKGYATKDVFLGNYISLDDDVRVEDVAIRMDAEVSALLGQPNGLTDPFDLIVHSTGALVARQWMLNLHRAGRPIPVQRLVMLAPANFGSRLAAVGKSMLGRLTKGLANRLETGQQMLRALELASPYQWDLTCGDLLAAPDADESTGPYGENGVMPFVIIGTRSYDSGPQQLVNENGSDGTVRVAAGNLNVSGITLDFTPAGNPVATPWKSRMPTPLPLAVLPERDHSEITRPDQSGDASLAFGGKLAELILQALACERAGYAAVERDWRKLSNETGLLAWDPKDDDDRILLAKQVAEEDTPVDVHTRKEVFHEKRFLRSGVPDRAHFHRYLQVIVLVRDNYGHHVGDYFLEFGEPNGVGQKSMITFHTDVLESVHNNSTNPAYRCLFIDHTDLLKIFYGPRSELGMSITAAPPGRNVKYFDSKTDAGRGQVTLHAETLQAREQMDWRLRRNQTHFVEVIIPRRPIDKVFTFLK